MRVASLLLAAALASPVLAQESDEAALALADRVTSEPTQRRACIESAELAAIDTTNGDGSPARNGGRASLSIRCDGSLGRQWRGVVAGRFDELWADGLAAQSVSTLKEAYLSFRPGTSFLLDTGRINVRQGVAYAYNPTDYFKADALRTIISIDPDTLRDERMGTLMGRMQALWASGSLTAIFAPRVDARPNDSTLNPDLGATNATNRWLLIWSQRLSQDFQPQISLTRAEHESPQVGLNVTYLLNRATVAYLEWSGGRSQSNLALSGYDRPMPASTAVAFHSRLSTGLTYTTSYKLSVTAEYEYDEAAPARSEWAAVRAGPIPSYEQYRRYAGGAGELATRQNVFAYAHWDDVGINHLGLTALVRFDPYDHSRVAWAEARYHWQKAGVALQWQRNTGAAVSDLVFWPMRQSWVALIDYYF
jgi:hypothetical protein